VKIKENEKIETPAGIEKTNKVKRYMLRVIELALHESTKVKRGIKIFALT
jgi:hypothetical protein